MQIENQTESPVLDIPIIDNPDTNDIDSTEIEPQWNDQSEPVATEKTKSELLESLQERLKNGEFPVEMSNSSLRHIRSFLLSKAVYKGQEEAIYLASALFVIEGMVNREGEVKAAQKDQRKVYPMPGQIIGILNYFLSKSEGVGYNSAKTYLEMSVPIRNGNEKVTEVHQLVEQLKKEILTIEELRK